MIPNDFAERQMFSDAKFGFSYSYLRISKKKVKELKSQGFTLTDAKQTKDFPRLFKISWAEAKMDGVNAKELNENDEKYNLAQKLWIISKKRPLV